MGKLDVNVFSEGVPVGHVIANVVSLGDLIILVKYDFVVDPDEEFFIIPRVHFPELELDLNGVMRGHLKESCDRRSGTKYTSTSEDLISTAGIEDIVSSE